MTSLPVVSRGDVRERSVHGDGAHVEALQRLAQGQTVIEGRAAPDEPLHRGESRHERLNESESTASV